ncbi:hypothetical protein EJB05_10432 [Eragrostis curvula]|uniref:Uncharacterized protein n=1 Tax=Eragrostis curvula TaxID=38414 RepID=A0A5J9VNU0_9POAL|nr:hypothetical protein EJB05_10432 [Eragrostis curvula]
MRLLDIRGRPASLLPSPSLPLRQIRRAAAAAAPAPPSSPPVDPTHHPTRGRLRRQPWSRLCRTTTREWRRRQDRNGHVFLVTGGASPVLPQLADFPCTQVNLPIPRSPSLFSPSFNPRSVVAACSIPCDLGPAAMDEAVAGSLVLPISMSPSQVQNGYITLQSNLDVKISFRWTKRVPGASVAPPVQQPILEYVSWPCCSFFAAAASCPLQLFQDDFSLPFGYPKEGPPWRQPERYLPLISYQPYADR